MKRRTLEELTAQAIATADALRAKLAKQNLVKGDVNVRRGTQLVRSIDIFLKGLDTQDLDLDTNLHRAAASINRWIEGKVR